MRTLRMLCSMALILTLALAFLQVTAPLALAAPCPEDCVQACQDGCGSCACYGLCITLCAPAGCTFPPCR